MRRHEQRRDTSAEIEIDHICVGGMDYVKTACGKIYSVALARSYAFGGGYYSMRQLLTADGPIRRRVAEIFASRASKYY